MSDNLENLRATALQHIRLSIGDHFNYNDFLAVEDVGQMNASDLTAVTAMTDDEMVNRWAYEYEYVSIPLTGPLGEWLKTKDDIETLVIKALEQLRAAEQETTANG
jgi:hypothetical protein